MKFCFSWVVMFSCGCTWVKPNEGVEAIAVVPLAEVENCKKLRSTTVYVKDKVGFVNRGDKKVAQELVTLAKNTALDNGGDTIAASSEPSEGKQRFGIYRCRP